MTQKHPSILSWLNFYVNHQGATKSAKVTRLDSTASLNTNNNIFSSLVKSFRDPSSYGE